MYKMNSENVGSQPSSQQAQQLTRYSGSTLSQWKTWGEEGVGYSLSRVQYQPCWKRAKSFSVVIKWKPICWGGFEIHRPFPAPFNPWLGVFAGFVGFPTKRGVNGSAICINSWELMTPGRSLMKIKNCAALRIEPWENTVNMKWSECVTVQNDYHYSIS